MNSPSETTPGPDPHRGYLDDLVRDLRTSAQRAGSRLEVYRTALDRIMESVGAAFGSVYLRDPEQPELLRLETARNWSQSWARFLSNVRIREGRGPTGLAVLEARPIEVEDVFEDPELEAWWEAARELGFVSVTAHPLMAGQRVLGSVTFYFQKRRVFDPLVRSYLSAAAREMTTAAEAFGR